MSFNLFNGLTFQTKIVAAGILLPALLIGGLFYLNSIQTHDDVILAYVEKARATTLTAESTREVMDAKWEIGIFTQQMLHQWADEGRKDKVLAAVPVVSAWEAAQLKADIGGYTFKVPKVDPRNPKNRPDKIELVALNAFKANSSLEEYHMIDDELNAVRYFRPIRLTESCMSCHGDPADSQVLWGNNQGLDPTGSRMENWKVGEIHGAFEVVQSLDAADAHLAETQASALKLVVVSLVVCGVIFYIVTTRSVNSGVYKPISIVAEKLREGSSRVSSASQQISQSSQTLAEGSTEQAASLEETSSSLEEMSSMTKQNADNSNQANSLAAEARSFAEKGNDAMVRMNEAINDIQKSADETAKIIKVIDEIAFQTNLLALNAAVEAARAGEAGKGFAVVAEEVRNLAMRSADAAKDTAKMIEESVKNSQNGVAIATEVSELLQQITDGNRKVSELISEISASSNEQSQGIDQLNTAVSQIDQVTQKNAANAEESASASQELNSQSAALNNVVEELASLLGGDNSSKTSPVASSPTARKKTSAVMSPSQKIPLEDEDDTFSDF